MKHIRNILLLITLIFAFVMQAEVYQNMLWNFNGAYYLSSRYTTTNDDMDLFLANAEDTAEKHGVHIFSTFNQRVSNYQTKLYIYGDDTVVRDSLKSMMDVEDEDMIQEEFPDDENSNVAFPQKHKHRGLIFNIVIVILFLIFVRKAMWPMITGENSKQPSVSTEKLMDHLEVKGLLEEKGFNTVNMPTSYWFFDEDKLLYVASGEKGESKVEFYEYSDGETTDGVYNRISYDFNQDLEFKERENMKESWNRVVKFLK